MKTSAEFSDDRTYRYRLDRVWDDTTRNRLVVIGLNPSTADETLDDPTIRRCIYFAQRERMGGLIMLNLFAFRATDPREMRHCTHPVGNGSDNDIFILAALHRSERGRGPVVAAWGCHGAHLGRGDAVRKLLHKHGAALKVFGLTKHGHPRHPLFLRNDTPLIDLHVFSRKARNV